ncbi:MAG TPA: preprotein translocase subunit SecA, partial [Gammaproteobacteria bacterium]|nr:preprotein translocase subunit SecA [Gammaproteobacteria bacterium]
MIGNVITKVFGSRNQRLIKRMQKHVDQINAFEDGLAALDDTALRDKTGEFKERLQAGSDTLESLLPEAFAVVREASVRVLKMRHFDVQMVGGMVLHNGQIAEMRTGEGKTLVATLPAYLNALTGQSVHIITVNDYLASRDAAWMGKIHEFLGLSVGVILSGQDNESKRVAYAADITYGTNNEFGFDYLRDNMAFSGEERVQRALYFAIVDEVDSILIDEARTPLIISGPAEGDTDLYNKIDKIIPQLTKQEDEDGPGDYSVDEKARQVFLTEEGQEQAEKKLLEIGLLGENSSLYEVGNIALMHHVNAALRAHTLFARDVDYMIHNGQIAIIDEFTGRMMSGRRWSEGLHQAVEAKEGVEVQQENQTLASITFQNYFRLYDKLSGMTGTADTESVEFHQIYGLEVVVVPTNVEMIREDMSDLVYRTQKEKYHAIFETIQDCRERQQPALVGTASVESSEYLSGLLNKESIQHQVLNAKHHESEAQIIAQAGRPGAVTIATNMAGRGTDIVLGGNLEMELAEVTDEAEAEDRRQQWQQRHEAVIKAGGLFVVGTERNESRRVDNQLRGRSGRQGDPGRSRFYVSMEDNLMRIFGSERISSLMQKLGMEEGEAIEHTWVTRAIENAQKKIEGRNFDIRKQLLEYDDVANEQRKVVYQQRNHFMESEEISDFIAQIRTEVVAQVINQSIAPQTLEEQWDLDGLENDFLERFALTIPARQWLEDDDQLNEEHLRERLQQAVSTAYAEKRQRYGDEVMQHLEKAVMLQVLDGQWREHLANMDHLRQGIHLRGYAQKDPKQEFKREAFELFSAMLDSVRVEAISVLSRMEIRAAEEEVDHYGQRPAEESMQFLHPDAEQ